MLTLEDYLKSTTSENISKEEAHLLLIAIQNASGEIADKVNRAGLADILGSVGEENIQGEEQQKLDIIANDILVSEFKKCGIVAAAASEEEEHIVAFDSSPNADFVVAYDPLDGSSNIDVNVSIGTIFTVFKRQSDEEVSENAFLQHGRNQVLAGYVIYGPSTMLVFTMGEGVQGFTLDPDSGNFILTHENIRTPESGRIYSVNEGNANSFSDNLKKYVDYCQSSNNDKGAPYSGRYIGSMVADFHRNLLKGGIFMYPATSSAPKGKLRLLYECLPLSFVMEQAGGLSHSGEKDIMELTVNELHQRVPIIIGSNKMVEKYLSLTD